MWITAAKFALSGILGPAWVAKLIGIGVGIVALLGTYVVWKHKIYTEGWNDHAEQIAQENRAVVADNAARLSIVRGCKSRGLRYEQTTRQCGGPI